MDTVLGMSMTSSGIAWVLQHGVGADQQTLDHDHFPVPADVATDGDISKHLAAVRGARAIAEASGHQVRVIGLTSSSDVEAKAALLLKALPDMGFDRVVAVPLAAAAQRWARPFGRCALCVIEPSAVTVVTVLDNSVRTAATQMCESADGIARWLTGVFEVDWSQPESMYLAGRRGDLELVADTLDEALPMPVNASEEAQLALARGAACAAPAQPEPAAADKTVRPATSAPRSYGRFARHARAATVLVAGLAALVAIGSGLVADDAPPVPTEAVAETSPADSAPSISVHAVPSAPPPPAVVEQFASTPVPAQTPAAVVANVAPETITDPGADTAADTTVPEVAPAVVEASPEAAPTEPAPEVTLVAALPAPEAAAPEPAPPAPPAVPMPPPPDPIQIVLSPLFGGLP